MTIIRIRNLRSILFIIYCTCLVLNFHTSNAMAGNIAITETKVIYASLDRNFIDPELKNLAEELGSVFRYTSYKLIKTKHMVLNNNQQGIVNIPGERSLIVTPIDISNKKIKYQISIFKSGNQIFTTKILLKNRRSITIGGPKFKNGYLIFNIAGQIQ